jgi:SAM-dependent methyltransferase
MKECSKSVVRRLADSNFIRRYFVGRGLDIGGKPDPLALYLEMFPLALSVRTWDREDGDAQFLESVADGEFDFVHSSHCLEHLLDPSEGLRNWLRVIRDGGHLIVTVPDEDLYEQGVFPSEFNLDHKHTFTIFKQNSWCDKSINVLELVLGLGAAAEVIKIEQLSASYRFNLPRFDQTLTPIGECGIEIIIRKRPAAESVSGGRLAASFTQPSREMRLHLNQYKDDVRLIKKLNETHPPFVNDADI